MTAVPPRSPPGATDYALLLLLAAIWGSGYMFIKIAVASIPALPMTTLRLALAALMMWAVARLAGESLPRDGRLWIFIALSGLFGNALPFFLIGWGEERIDSALAAILMAPMPLITVALAHFFTRDENLTAAKLLGVALGFAGLVVLIGPDRLARLGTDAWGEIAVASAAGCYAINAVLSKQLVASARLGTAAAVILTGAALLAPVSLVQPGTWEFEPTSGSLLAVFVLAGAQTAIGTLLLFSIIRRQGALFFSQTNFLIPLFGVFWGATVLAERPSLNALIALVLILLGLAVVRRASAVRP